MRRERGAYRGATSYRHGVADPPVPPPSSADADPGDASHAARTRRHPRYGRFIGAGAVAGVLVALVLVAFAAGPTRQFGVGQVVVYLGALLAFVGGLLGGGVAVVLEGRSQRDRPPSP